MMKRLRKSVGESERSFQPQQSQFASRPFIQRAEEHEAPVGELPISFSLADIDIFPRETVQPKLRLGPAGDWYEKERVQHMPNRTGMPDRLKAGIESLSGIDMSDVRVHANSDKPAGLNALAYTQGNQIHLGPGQAKHLPHEAWHAVQQKEGRVRATKQLTDGIPVNDDEGLEWEADKMGGRALQMGGDGGLQNLTRSTLEGQASDLPGRGDKKAEASCAGRAHALQRKVGFEFEIANVSTTKLGYFGRRKKLAKSDQLVAGARYKIEADEDNASDPCYANPGYSGYSDLEVVTDPFPVTVAGFHDLIMALAEIGDNLNYVLTHPNVDIGADALPYGVSTPNRFIRYNGGDSRGTPQATVGLSLSALNDLFRAISPQPGVAGPARFEQELFGGGLDPGLSFSLGGTAGAIGLVNVDASRTAALAEIAATLPMAERTPEMVALVTQLVMYLNLGEVGASGYGKTIAGAFMMRTDFAEAYRAIPDHGRILTNANPNLFSLMVCRAARRVNPRVNDDGDLFSGGIYAAAKHQPGFAGPSPDPKTATDRSMLTGRLRRRDWLTGIALGVDRLTAQHFPTRFGRARRQRAEIESLGSYGRTTDPLGLARLPLIEFRGLPRVLPGLFTIMAMDIFRYVFALNTGGGGGNPGQLQLLNPNARANLLDPSNPDHVANRVTAIDEATLAVAVWGADSGGD